MAEHILSLLRGLDRNRFSPGLACPPGLLADKTADLGVPVHPIAISSTSNPFKFFFNARALARLMGREKPQILHSHAWSASAAAALALRLTRQRPYLVCTIHNYPPEGWLARRIVNRVARAADRIICVSRALTYLLNESQEEKSEVIPNGIEIPDSFHSREALRRQMGLPQEVPIAGTVARFAPQKGIAILLEVAAKVKEAHFAVIGEGPLKPELEARARGLGLRDRFHFLGRVPEAKSLLPAFDLVAIPSLSEGSSIAAMEAMAAGRPIVASRLGALEEIIVEGETGLLVAPGSSEELAAAIEKVLRNPSLAAKMGEAGNLRVRQNFTLEQMLERTAALYDALVSQRGGQQ